MALLAALKKDTYILQFSEDDDPFLCHSCSRGSTLILAQVAHITNKRTQGLSDEEYLFLLGNLLAIKLPVNTCNMRHIQYTALKDAIYTECSMIRTRCRTAVFKDELMYRACKAALST